MNRDMSELLLDYIEHLEVEGGRSAKTAENYHLYLDRVSIAYGSTAFITNATRNSPQSPKPTT
jgi:hypothetical protein